MKFHNVYRKTKLSAAIRFVFLWCILMSSCAVKGSIKNLLQLHPNAKSNTNAFQNKSLTTGAASACSFCKEKELAVTVEKSKVKGLHSDELVTAVIPQLRVNPQDLPRTGYRSSEIFSKLPLFIRYRKLII